jgi:hypothetical protein
MYASPVSDDTTPSPEQLAALRRLAPSEKLLIAGALYEEARRLKAAGLRAQHPEWSEEDIARAVRNVFLHGHVSA